MASPTLAGIYEYVFPAVHTLRLEGFVLPDESSIESYPADFDSVAIGIKYSGPSR